MKAILLLILFLINFYPVGLFVLYSKKNKVEKKDIFIWGLITLLINFYLVPYLTPNEAYREIVIFNTLLSMGVNYLYTFGKGIFINNKKLPKSFVVLLSFFLVEIFQSIALLFLKYDVKNLAASQTLVLTTISDIVLVIILGFLYFKDLKKDIKDFKKNFNEYADIAFKYWLVGFVVMVVSNIIIGLFITQAKGTNEETVQEILHSTGYISLIAIGLIGPINEELVFRKSFKDIIKNDTLFVLTSGLVFGGLHVLLKLNSAWDLFLIIPYSSLGIAFAMMYRKTNNIFTSMFTHIIHNTVLALLSIIGLGVILL